MTQSTNVITNQQGMHNLYPSFVITKYHTPQEMTHSIYIYKGTNTERITHNKTKQEQLKKDSFNYNNL